MDGGESKVGVESTVLDVTGKDPVILRPGGITREEIETIVGQVLCHQGLGKKSVPRAPGMKYVHYSPKAEVVIIAKNSKYMGNKMMTVSRNLEKEGKKVALLISRETLDEMKGLMLPHYVQVLGSRDNLPQVAHYLFSAFRNCDLSGADIILIEEFSREGMGEAVMNRILKAAGNKIIN